MGVCAVAGVVDALGGAVGVGQKRRAPAGLAAQGGDDGGAALVVAADSGQLEQVLVGLGAGGAVAGGRRQEAGAVHDLGGGTGSSRAGGVFALVFSAEGVAASLEGLGRQRAHEIHLHVGELAVSLLNGLLGLVKAPTHVANAVGDGAFEALAKLARCLRRQRRRKEGAAAAGDGGLQPVAQLAGVIAVARGHLGQRLGHGRVSASMWARPSPSPARERCPRASFV